MARGGFDAATIERLVPMKRAGSAARGRRAGRLPGLAPRPATSAARSSRSTARCTETHARRTLASTTTRARQARARHGCAGIGRRDGHSADATSRHDVIIVGGGLAGLTLALQLRQRLPDLDVLVLERRAHPVPEARTRSASRRSRSPRTTSARCSGSSRTCADRQLKKFGFRFFFSDGERDLAKVTELGASTYPVDADLPARPRHLRERPRPRSPRRAASASPTRGGARLRARQRRRARTGCATSRPVRATTPSAAG